MTIKNGVGKSDPVFYAHPGRGMEDIVSIKFLVISPDVYLG
jgi:hypothetical protein